MNQSKRLLIDKRTKEDILADIRQKARYYTPEWEIDEKRPDIGYALSMMFAKQMGENIDSLNQILDNYHTEFINMLDISPKSARPAEGLVEFSLGIDTISGTYIPKGTKLRTDDETSLIFETQNSIYVTGSNIVGMFMVDGEDGYVRPIKGNFDVPNLLPTPEEDNDDTEETEENENEGNNNFYSVNEFRLFGEENSISKNSVYFYHGSVVDTGDNPLFIRINGSEKLKEGILSGDYVFLWYTEGGLKEFKEVTLMEDGVTFCLKRGFEHKIKTVPISGREYNLIVLDSKVPVRENIPVNSIKFSSKGDPLPIDFATDGNLDKNVESFNLFGDELTPYAQCYIGMENYFDKTGARIDFEFDVTYKEHIFDLQGMGDAAVAELKVIKKKPKKRSIDLAAECVVNKISVEYYNGSGWKKLDTLSPCAPMFAQTKAGTYKISFVAPKDWEPSDVGAYQGRMIKLQVITADNSYMRPSKHYYPVISNTRVTYTYEDKFLPPLRTKSIVGTKIYDLSKSVFEERQFNMFASTEYFSDSLYIGFSKPLDNGPISMMFQIEERFNHGDLRYVFEYSSANGFRPLKVIDNTVGMTRTGIVTFLPQSDMSRTVIEGKQLYWIRIVRDKNMDKEDKNLLPVIKDIRLNTVKVANIDRLEEREVYIESVYTNQVIPIREQDILDIDLWVNELGYISLFELDQIKNERPQDVEVEYDSAGNMTRCFIRYDECNSLELAEHKRVYLLDRINGEIIFGDGIKTATPRVLDDVALKFSVRKSQGSRGNLDSGSITNSVGNLLYIEEINNPLKVYNGSDMEDVESVLERGSLLLKARNRLLSEGDYKKEIFLFNGSVKGIKIICETLRNGKVDPLAVSCVLLLKDYELGRSAFDQIGEGIKKHLLNNCELTINADNLHIVEPIFVKISVDIWVESVNIDESFELQNILKEDLENYLNPLNDWKIGTLPKVSQIMMRLNVLKSKAVVKKSVIIAQYEDQFGRHEMDLKNVKINPYMICKSGTHNVHMILAN